MLAFSRTCGERKKSLRIISGSARGLALAGFSGKDIRPTPDRVREAVFSMIVSRLVGFSGLRVLDLFAGSGAMGLEALSRGAEQAVFVDSGSQSWSLIEKNLERCRMQDRSHVMRRNVNQALSELARGKSRFDLVFLDPPYDKGLVERTLVELVRSDLLADEALVVAESDLKEPQPETVAGLEKLNSRHFGRSRIELFMPMVSR